MADNLLTAFNKGNEFCVPFGCAAADNAVHNILLKKPTCLGPVIIFNGCHLKGLNTIDLEGNRRALALGVHHQPHTLRFCKFPYAREA